ncbi:MAG TPA: beta-N-acetylhexosaminidase [Bryobacteraceae bacterium]|nr:beta-N-acetylhexosaminidase [Bryobacteraceae bacterium]
MRIHRSFLIGAVCLSGAFAAHSPLLPKPRDIHYGPGQLPLRGLTIRLGWNSASEDRFAAEQLAAILSARSPTPVTIAYDVVVAPSILLTRTGSIAALAQPGEHPGPDSREAYRLKITPAGGEVEANSSAGLFYAVQTLRQLIEGGERDAALPEVEIRDWPALAYRGTMVDMSHGQLPTEDEVKRQLDFLARWKANQYYFYSEASIELDGYPLLNPGGRFTKPQIERIVAYGRERHIDVIPFLELYGHLHDLLRIELYSDLGAYPHAAELDPTNPKVTALLADWARQISALFPSTFVHVGFDETWQIENAAKKHGGGITPAELFAEQLSKVSQLFQQRGKTVMAWADIVVKYPAIIDRLPRGLIPVAWAYEAQPDIKKWLDPLVARRLPHFIQSGVANWKAIALDFDLTFANIDNFLAAGRKSGALGMINSVWTDSAQGFLRLTLPAMAYGTAAPWQSAAMDRAGFFSQYAALMYSPAAAPDAAAVLDNLNKAEVSIEKTLGEASIHAMWDDPFSAPSLKRSAAHREDLRQTRLLSEQAQMHLYRALNAGGDAGTLNTLLLGGRMLDFAAYKFLNALEIAERWRSFGRYNADRYWNEFESDVVYQSHGRFADMMDAASELRNAYRSAWLAESTPYRMNAALGRWDGEHQYWLRLQNRFRNATRGLKNGDNLPPIESILGRE